MADFTKLATLVYSVSAGVRESARSISSVPTVENPSLGAGGYGVGGARVTIEAGGGTADPQETVKHEVCVFVKTRNCFRRVDGRGVGLGGRC